MLSGRSLLANISKFSNFSRLCSMVTGSSAKRMEMP
ncbi:hypothetical protein EVA_11290 [gut metagenome]|uniref:Uncharacterized protein n=1 Tax=gut metagenome TaxID=749906 RepID=J9G058_9ZZZZ